MKVSFIKAALIVIVLFSQLMVGYANEAVKYELTREKVKKAWLVETSSGYSVHVDLKETYRKEFAELTGNNIGRRLEVIVSGELLTSETIKARILHGTIIPSRKWSSGGEARKFLETVMPDIAISEVLESFTTEGDCPQNPEIEITAIKGFADWLVTRGIPSYYRAGDFRKIRDYAREKGISISVQPMIPYGEASSYPFFVGDDRPVLLLISTLCYRGLGTLLNRIQQDDKLYELWNISSEYIPLTRFYATETGRLTEERKIIVRSDKFFSEFSLADGTKIKFPYISFHAVFYLRPDDLPEGFKNTVFEKLTAKDVVKSHKKINLPGEVGRDFEHEIYDYARWMITRGVASYYEDKDFKKLRDQVLKKKGVKLTYLDEPPYSYILGFVAKHYGFKSGGNLCSKPDPELKVISSRIRLLDRIEHDNSLYEFWFVYIEEWRPCKETMESNKHAYSIRFFAAETEGLTRDRKIVVESDKFFREFSLPDGTKLRFPPVKIFSIAGLTPWYIEKAFEGTELEGIYIDDLVKLP